MAERTCARIVAHPPRNTSRVITSAAVARDRQRRHVGRNAPVVARIEPAGAAYLVRLFNAARVEVGTVPAVDLDDARRIVRERTA